MPNLAERSRRGERVVSLGDLGHGAFSTGSRDEQHRSRLCTLIIALTAWTEPVLARSYLNCLATKVVIIDALNRSTSSSVQEHLGFWIDEAAKTIMLANGTSLTVRRFDDHWISAALGEFSYELDRENGNLSYASSTTMDGVAKITIGSGRCEIAPGPEGGGRSPSFRAAPRLHWTMVSYATYFRGTLLNQ